MLELKALFQTQLGKRVLDGLKQQYMDTKLFEPADTHTTAYRIGQHDVINDILTEVEEEAGDGRNRVDGNFT